MWQLIRLTLLLCLISLWTADFSIAQVPELDLLARADELDAATIRAWILSSTQPTGKPVVLVIAPIDVAALDTLRGSPIDTLHKSIAEKIFWGRNGFYRTTGLFKTDPENPTNDLRNLARWRRKMLGLHQTLGLVTIASMTATVVGGQLAVNGQGSSLHKASLPFTIGLYATTATLAVTSPPKLVPTHGIDTVTFHKYFAVAHFAGMVITPLLAPEDDSNPRTHQVLGYATYAAFTTGMLIVMLLR